MKSLLKYLFFLTLTSISLALEPSYSINQNGKQVKYSVSQTEFHCSPNNGKKTFIHKVQAKQKHNDIITNVKNVAKNTASSVQIILYPENAEQNAQNRRIVTNEAQVKITNNTSIKELVKSSGATSFKKLSFTDEYIILVFANSWTCLENSASLKKNKTIQSITPLLKKTYAKKNTLNDPLYLFSHNNEGYQWHLNNTGDNNGTHGIDVNIANVWSKYTGNGITVGIVDDGLQTDHPDLINNVNTNIDFNWNNGNQNDPSPQSASENHGTPCAGVTAASYNNSIGGTGAAPNATLVGLRLIADEFSDLQSAEAMAHQNGLIAVKSNSWGPDDGFNQLEGIPPLTSAALNDSITNGRNGLGTIHVWAAGNGGDFDNVNCDGFANSIFTIAVGAINDQGNRSYYSEPGAAKLISAPSDGGGQGITTTQINSTYTNSFGGTSSATPLVSGIIALMLEANPELAWRDVQEILIRSARQIKPNDPKWIINGANIAFNHDFGAGLVDAELATQLSETWTNLAPQQSHTINASNLPLNITDNNTNGSSITFNVPANQNFRVEHVTLTTNITHSKISELTITLTSPSGTTSILNPANILDSTLIPDWTYMSVFNWGEASQGTWTLNVTDSAGGNTGTLNSASLKIFGAPISPASAPPTFLNSNATTEYTGTNFHFKAFATDNITSYSATNLPSGLSINPKTGDITGTANTPNVYNVTVTATNSQGSTSSQLEITILDPSPRAPRISSPSKLRTWVNLPISYQITADFSPTSFSSSNLPQGLTLNTSTGLISGTPTQIGNSPVTITATNNIGSHSITLDLMVFPYSEIIREAVDFSGINWPNDITTGYTLDTNTTSDGIDALRFPDLRNGQNFTLQIQLQGPGTLSFKYKVSSEADYDLFLFKVDGIEKIEDSGDQNWKTYTQTIPAGIHTIEWTYSKDNSVSELQDTLFLDQVNWVRSDLSHYQNWKLAKFSTSEANNTTISGDSADSDNDGIPNLLEYATGNSPLSSINANPITMSSNQTEISITYPFDTSAQDVNLIGQSSTTLNAWSLRSHTIVSTSGNIEQRKISYPFNQNKAFLRLQATLK